MHEISASRNIRTVSEINREIQTLLDHHYRFVRILGEVSTLRKPFSGHCYFNLKDKESQIRAVLFKSQQRYLSEELRDGQQVICDGRIGLYEPRGEYQLIVDTVDFQGHGKLQMEFERLKARLKREGLFDTERKKPLPAVVRKIALITSPSGAAVHDFLAICRNREMDVHIQLLPVPVQGEGASTEICSAIKTAHALLPDVIVLCRGGGSIEDLWAFNDETLAHCISVADVPIVTGIGHETDFTIADFCADVRAATPTAAAEILTTDQSLYSKRVQELVGRITRMIHWHLESHNQRLRRFSSILTTLDGAFRQQHRILETAFERFAGGMDKRLDHLSLRLASHELLLLRYAPRQQIELHQNRVDQLKKSLGHCIETQLSKKQNLLQKYAAVLDSLSPLATLGRGYALVSRRDPDTGKRSLVRDAAELRIEDRIVIRLNRGEADCRVTDVREDGPDPPPG